MLVFMKGKQSFRRNSSVCYERKACRKRVYVNTQITASSVSCDPSDIHSFALDWKILLNDFHFIRKLCRLLLNSDKILI